MAISLIAEIIFCLSVGLHAAVVTIPAYPAPPDNRKAHFDNGIGYFENKKPRFENGHSKQVLQPLWIFEEVDPENRTERPVADETAGEIFTVTGYCKCVICCGVWSAEHPSRGADYEQLTASGTTPTAGRTCGADWAVLPGGTVILIEGVGVRVVEDKGAVWISKRYAGKFIDLYFDSHEAAVAFGKQELVVRRAASE